VRAWLVHGVAHCAALHIRVFAQAISALRGTFFITSILVLFLSCYSLVRRPSPCAPATHPSLPSGLPPPPARPHKPTTGSSADAAGWCVPVLAQMWQGECNSNRCKPGRRAVAAQGWRRWFVRARVSVRVCLGRCLCWSRARGARAISTKKCSTTSAPTARPPQRTQRRQRLCNTERRLCNTERRLCNTERRLCNTARTGLRFVFFRIASLYSCTHDTLRSISALSSITSTLTPTCVPRATAAHKRRATRVRKHCCSYSPSAIYTKETLQANLTCSFSRAERYGSNPNCTQVRYI
jgi:hypothetical protein